MLRSRPGAIGRPQLVKRQAEYQGQSVAPLKQSGGIEVLQVQALPEPPQCPFFQFADAFRGNA